MLMRIREAAVCRETAQEFATEARHMLPESPLNRRRVWDLAEGHVFGTKARRLRVVLPVAAVFFVGWSLPSPLDWRPMAAPTLAEAHKLDRDYWAMRETTKFAIRDQVSPRVVIRPDGTCAMVVFNRRAGDPWAILHKSDEQPVDCDKAVEVASRLARD